jgi:hypothetical protein
VCNHGGDPHSARPFPASSDLTNNDDEPEILTRMGYMDEHKENNTMYWMVSVQSEGLQTAETVIEMLVGEERMFALSNKGSTKSAVKPGDWICLYASGKGVVAHARVKSVPERKVHPKVDYRRYPWLVSLEERYLYLSHPRVINTALRSHLDAFHTREPAGQWSWFVQRARRVSRHDFTMLTRQEHTAS